ncbi:TetR/AcrR family transcriptional regulator [Caulobacter soli]|uniref:TetR/AcrR family transcriptional regulator n=1 Tax=Caulobacter soli TaxID=2708539 RepID=UPI0013E9FB42|nr:TetR/AcrR family transcriptional regulator [Caulobacter soli]
MKTSDATRVAPASPASAASGTSTRREKTREAILAAAAKLLSERSIDGLSVDDITQASGVAKGTFYNHFPDKDALAVEIGRAVRTQSEIAVASLNDGVADAAMRVARGMCFYAKIALSDPVRASLMAQSARQDLSADLRIGSGLGADIAAGIATGRLRVATRDSATTFVVGAGSALILRLLAERHRTTGVMFAQQVVALTLRGLGLEAEEADQMAAQAADHVIQTDTPV